MIGWVLLSRQAVARADQALRDGERGVRDEVGFQFIHQAVANRLFPGTSVLQTRARYALLVPWLMKRVASSGTGEDLERRLLQAEGTLAGQFVAGQQKGLDADRAIGTDVWKQRRRPPVQPPSFSYWSALAEWGILLRRPDGSVPRRREVLRLLAGRGIRTRLSEDDPDPTSGTPSPFIGLPAAPLELGKTGIPLALSLTKEEQQFLRKQLLAVQRPDGKQSLLAVLADAGVGGNCHAAWDAAVVDLADEPDRQLLRLARHAASLTAIGRGVYATLVEQLWNEDRGGTSHINRDRLAKACRDHRPEAKQLDIDQLTQVFRDPELPSDFIELLRATQIWLRRGAPSPKVLLDCYRTAEWNRKDTRSKLTGKHSGRLRRDEWRPDKHPEPIPIGYRWRNVSWLLKDITV